MTAVNIPNRKEGGLPDPLDPERSSTPDSFTQFTVTSHSSGRTSPESFTHFAMPSPSIASHGGADHTTAASNQGVLFDADAKELPMNFSFPDEKQQGPQGQRSAQQPEDEALNQEHYRDCEPVPSDELRCSILSRRLAVWRVEDTDLKLSALAAAVLINEGKLKAKDLEVLNLPTPTEEVGPSDPISGLVAAAHGTLGGVVMGIADYPVEISKMINSDREVGKTLAKDFALDSGKGISRIIGTGLRAPMDFTWNLSKGFGNVPKLYGDETVRKPERVSGVEDGLEAGAKGLAFGLYDGVTGIFTQPVKGAQEGGVGGFFTGLGKGIGGAIFKPAAGAIGLPAYAFKGIYEEVQNARGLGTDALLKKKLLEKGQEEWECCSREEREAVLGRWFEL